MMRQYCRIFGLSCLLRNNTRKRPFFSVTIPSLIIASYGGGTSIGTQKECVEMLGCYGKDKVMKLAEIIAGVVFAVEISLVSAISSSDWVSSHEQYGRNR
jgi:hydroxymethylglutaryl-CoA reductase (NADPH)